MADSDGLIAYDDALEIVLSHATVSASETVGLDRLAGRVLAEPIRTPHEMPLFDNSAMDGYVLSAADAGDISHATVLQVTDTIRAGDDPADREVAPGRTMRIFTGAGVPNGAAAVVPQEDVVVKDGLVRVVGTVRMGQHIRRRGEEFRTGDMIVPAGMAATPAVVAALAAAGVARAAVRMRPTVGLLVTGEELVTPGETLAPGRIYECNSYGLTCALSEMGCPPDVRRSGDSPEGTRRALDALLDTCDVVITSGGVSVGEFDAVKPALADLGVEALFWGVAIKPGKPVYFGRRRAAGTAHGPVVFGLPGNPLAAMVTLYALVRPWMLASLGIDGRPRRVAARLAEAIRKKAGRMEFVPCVLRNGEAHPTSLRGSQMLGGLVTANALALFPAPATSLGTGDPISVMPIDWRLR